MSLLDSIAESIYLHKPEMFQKIRQSLCDHNVLDRDVSDGAVICESCDAFIGYDGTANDHDLKTKDSELK